MKRIAILFISVVVVISFKAFHKGNTTQTSEIHQETIKTSYEPIMSATRKIKPCTDSSFKSWYDFRAITNKSSRQYQMQQEATTGKYGIRTWYGFYMVAMTSHYGEVGDLVAIDFENQSIYAVIADIKDAGHDWCASDRDGSMLEFIVDKNVMDKQAKRSGNYNVIFKGSIKEIVNYGVRKEEQ